MSIDSPQSTTMFVVYFNTSDYPDRYVVRKWTVTKSTYQASDVPEIIAADLEAARAVVPSDKIRMPPMEHDDPVIVEVWI